jgi:hypothetical protein
VHGRNVEKRAHARKKLRVIFFPGDLTILGVSLQGPANPTSTTLAICRNEIRRPPSFPSTVALRLSHVDVRREATLPSRPKRATPVPNWLISTSTSARFVHGNLRYDSSLTSQQTSSRRPKVIQAPTNLVLLHTDVDHWFAQEPRVLAQTDWSKMTVSRTKRRDFFAGFWEEEQAYFYQVLRLFGAASLPFCDAGVCKSNRGRHHT